MSEHASRGGRDEKDRQRGADQGDGGLRHGPERTAQERISQERISRWEWLTAGLGLLLVLAALGYLGYEAVAGDDRPPSMVVAVDSVTTGRRGHVVHFTVRNEGDRAGAAVVVEGRLSGPGGAAGAASAAGGREETSEATLDYVPGRSRRSGGLYFTHDPRAGRLELRALGYSVP